MYENIPNELKKVKQWVCWTNDKLPKNPYTGGNAQSNNNTTWSDYETAVNAVSKYNFGGVGFMFAPPYFGVDLDECIDNQDFLDEFVETLQSYTEYSKSKNGIHIICKGVLPDGARRRGNVEMYSTGRYFITTGNLYDPKYIEVKDCTETIKILHNKHLYVEQPKVLPKQIQKLDLSDNEVIDKARNCKTGGVFQLLYSGNWEGLHTSQSEADMALCNQLAFWTQRDENKIDRIFRSSGLYREKWDKRRGSLTYGEITVQKAVASCNNVYELKPHQNDKDLALKFFKNKLIGEVSNVTYDMTDTGNANRLKDKYLGNIKYSYNRKKWLYWTGKIWAYDNSGQIKKLADEVIGDLKREAFTYPNEDDQEKMLKFASKIASSASKTAMIKETEHLEGVPVYPEELDSFNDYICCQNGIINLRNGELLPHDPNFAMTKITHSEYDPNGGEPERWLSFLNDITGGDLQLQVYLKKCIGYSLSGSIREQCAFFMYGSGNNGKSTFIETIADMLGDYGANVQPETIMMTKAQGSINSDIARLKSIRMAISEEPTEGVRLNEGLVKQLTGGGKITCRFLYGEDFEYTPEFKIWVATNHKPTIRGTDVGIWRRIRLIPFEVNIPKDKVDKNLKYKLRKEMPLILKWAIDGCILWQKEGLEPPKAVVDATKEYKSEMDLLQTFVEACIETDYSSPDIIASSDLYSLYTAWAEENKEYVMKSRKFFLDIGKKMPEKGRNSTGTVYKKIKLTEYAKSKMKKSYSANKFYWEDNNE